MGAATALLALLTSSRGPTVALPPVVVEHRVVLTIEPFLVERGKTRPAAEKVGLEVGPDSPRSAEVSFPWGRGLSGRLKIEARLVDVPEDGPARVQCAATVVLPGKAPARSTRDVALEDGSSTFYDVYEEEGRRLVLSVRSERLDRPVVLSSMHVGEPVRFLVAIERVDGDRTVLLETNQLSTFVGQSVQYAFRRGAEESLEAVTLDLLPVSITGDLVTIQADVSGALPGSDGASLLSRHERIIASRRATSALAATSGTPPAGYRFQVTPDF